MFIVDDPEAPVELPDTYGVDDVPLIVQDKAFDGDLVDSERFLSSWARWETRSWSTAPTTRTSRSRPSGSGSGC